MGLLHKRGRRALLPPGGWGDRKMEEEKRRKIIRKGAVNAERLIFLGGVTKDIQFDRAMESGSEIKTSYQEKKKRMPTKNRNPL